MASPPDAPTSRIAVFLGALAVLALAFGLRAYQLDSDRTSPDDGEFLRSARVHEMEPTWDTGRFLAEDRAWVGELAEDFGRAEERSTFQHGYLHQLCIRWAWRIGHQLGQGRIFALRADQALFGTLTALLAFLWLRRSSRGELGVAIVGGGLVATQLAHVHASRTGWGQAACTFWLLVAFWVAWRMRDVRNAEGGRLARHALAFALATVLAYGFHEMATVYVASLALIMLLEFPIGDDGRRRWPWRSPRFLWGWGACVPVGLLTLSLLLFSEYAQEEWFAAKIDATQAFTWTQVREFAFLYFRDAGMPVQIGWIVLVLAPIGFVGAFLRDGRWAKWLLLCAVVPSLVLFLRYNYPHLPRIYLPAFVILCLFAAEAFGMAWAFARTRWTRALVDGLAVGAIAFGALTSWQTFQEPASAPLHLSALHLPAGQPVADPRHPFDPVAEALRSRNVAEPVGVAWRWDATYHLFDAGFPATFFDARLPDSEWPRYVIGTLKDVGGGGRLLDDGGNWELIALDPFEKHALIERVR